MSLTLDDFISGLGGTILSSIRAPFGIFSNDYRVLWMNKALARIHSCQPEKIIGEVCYNAFHGCDKICDDCFLKEVMETGRTVILERSHRFADGNQRWGEIHAYPVRDNDRTISAIIVIIFETTSRIQSLKEQKEKTEQLVEQLNANEFQEFDQLSGSNQGIPIQQLTDREKEILKLIVDGYTNPQISDLLSISKNTVKRHISNLFDKLNVSDRTQAAVLAVRDKLI